MKRTLALASVLGLLLGFFWTNPASAHAELLGSEPPSGQALATPPTQVSLHFSEAVTPAQDGFRLYDQNSKQYKVSSAFHPNGDIATMAIDMPKLGDGQYVMVWRAISADSHSIHGALTFQIGEETSPVATATAAALLAADQADPAVRAIQGTLRGLLFLTTLLSLGALAMTVLWRDEFTRRFARWALVGLGVVTVLGAFSQGIYTNASPLASFFVIDLLRSTLETRYGYGALLRVTVVWLAIVLLQFRNRTTSLLALGCGFVVAASFAISGHAGTGRLPVAGTIFDIAHIVAASIWFGGLTLMCLRLLIKRLPTQAAQSFSSVALVCAITMATTGLLQAWRQLHSWHALTSTDYGRLVIAKTALFISLTVIASFARKAVQRWSDGDAPRSLRSFVLIEVAFAIAILVVTTVLTGTSPTATNTPTTYERSSTLGQLQVSLRVEPTRTGVSAVEISLKDANGTAASVPEVSMSLTLANEGIGPLNVELQNSSPGRYVSPNAAIPLPGTWTARVTVRTTDIDQSSTSFALPIS